MDKKTELEIIYDASIMGLSYRTLAGKYGLSRSQIHRMVMSKQREQPKPVVKLVLKEELPLPDNIADLKAELRLARLKIELQDLMLDISSKELGIDLRKKRGTRQSK